MHKVLDPHGPWVKLLEYLLPQYLHQSWNKKENYLGVVLEIEFCDWLDTQIFILYQWADVFLFTFLFLIFQRSFLNDGLRALIFTGFFIPSVSSCGVVVQNFVFLILFWTLVFWSFKFLLFFFLCLNFFSLDKLFQSLSLKSVLSFLQILFVLEVSFTNELLFRDFGNFFLVHTSRMQSLWTTNTLINWHGITADPTSVTVVKRASEMHWIGINVLEQFLCIVLFDALRMEEFSTVGCRTFGQFILSLIFAANFFYKILAIFPFAFFALFVLGAKVVAFAFADKALNKVRFTVLAAESKVSHFFELIIFHAKFLDFIFGSDVVIVLVALVFVFFLAFGMEGSFAVALAEDSAFGFFTEMTEFFEILLFFGISDLVFIGAFLLIFFLFLIAENVIILLGTSVNLLLLNWSRYPFFRDLKFLNIKLLKSSWRFTDLFQPLTCQIPIMLVELSLWVHNCQELT